ncbi:MAG: hypothetical protein Q9187_004838 [Circinaria calcarea]
MPMMSCSDDKKRGRQKRRESLLLSIAVTASDKAPSAPTRIKQRVPLSSMGSWKRAPPLPVPLEALWTLYGPKQLDGLEGLAAPCIADDKVRRPLIDEDSLAMGILDSEARHDVVKRGECRALRGIEPIKCLMFRPIIFQHYRPRSLAVRRV